MWGGLLGGEFLFGAVEGLREVGEDVVDVLDADREADVAGADAGRELLFRGELAVGRAGRVDRQRTGIADDWRRGRPSAAGR